MGRKAENNDPDSHSSFLQSDASPLNIPPPPPSRTPSGKDTETPDPEPSASSSESIQDRGPEAERPFPILRMPLLQNKNRHPRLRMHPRAPTRIFVPLLTTLPKKKKKSPRALGKWGCSFAMLLRTAEIPGKWYVPKPQRMANLPARPQRAEGQVPRAQSSKKGTDAAAAACMVCRQPASLETLSSSCPGSWSGSFAQSPPARLGRPFPAPADAAAAVALQPPPRRCLSAALCSAGASVGGGS